MNVVPRAYDKIKSVFKVLTLKDFVVVFLLNSVSALINTSYYFIRGEVPLADFHIIIDYMKVYHVLGFTLMFSYLLLSPGPDSQLNLWRVLAMGVLTLALSTPISLLFIDWYPSNMAPFMTAFTYLGASLLLVAWPIFLVTYLKRRESNTYFARLQRQIAQTTKQRDRAELELHLLQAQLEPHFFFNTLANLHSLIDIDADRAKQLLEELTQYLRSSIPQFRQRFISVDNEIDITRHYLKIQKIRYGEKLQFDISVDEGAGRQLMLPMSLLTLVENSIKHGIEKVKGSGNISITVTLVKSGVQITVVDDAGQLREPVLGTGLTNLQERLSNVYQGEAHFSLQHKNAMTVATLEFPGYV